MLRSRRSLKPAANAPSLLFILEKTVPEAASSERVSHADLANAVRALAMDAVEQAKSGHPGLPMGAADIATALFTRHLKYDAADPFWPDRDRFILSAGHGSMLLYALLHLTGAAAVSIEEIKRFRQLESKTPGHPENFMTPGVETTTGPLGQGLATAVGFALAERMLNAAFGDALVDHRTYVLASDGDLMEGVSQEAIALAGHLKLNRLIVLFDDNGISIDGPLSLSDSVDQAQRFEAAGWRTTRIDGHDPEAISRALDEAKAADRPTLIACRTTIGYGAPKKAGTAKAHGEPLGADELSGAKAALGWSHAPFQVPPEIRSAWAEAGRRGRAEREAWTKRLEGADRRAEFTRRMACERPAGLSQAIAQLKQKLFAEPQTIATRKASEIALDAVTGAVPELVLGSADLTGSNNTKTKNLSVVSPGSYGGRYIHYGIREHGMAAAMNGLALHGGFIPAGGTFLVFSDYARPAMRIAALSGIPAIYVLTHDSIGLGEDGPTHQPVEHLAALRAMPNMRVFRPADAVETAECWQLALERTEGPTVLALTRQNLPQIRKAAGDGGNLCAAGAYEISPSRDGRAKATIFASGSEVEVALGAQTILTERGMAARVVSVPSLELFLSQPADVRRRIVGDAPVRVAVEAAVRFGWDALIGPDGVFVGMHGFGASAPYKDLYRHFGITPEAVAEQVLRTHNL